MTTAKYKILYIDNSFTFGGAINSLLYLLRGIDRCKYEPIIITGQSEQFMSDHFGTLTWYSVPLSLPWLHNKWYEKIASMKIFRIPLLHTALKVARKIYWLLFIIFPEGIRYYKIGKRHSVDIVHLNNILGSQLAGVIAAKMLRVPCVAHLRDFEVVHPITKFIAALIDAHVAISTAIQKNLLALGVPIGRISVIFDGIDLDTFCDDVQVKYLSDEFDAGGCICFGIFGRVIEWKGVKEFVSAAALVCKEIPETKAFIVGDYSDGDQEYFNDVKELVSSLGLSNKIIFTGYRRDVPALMKLMDIVVHASIDPEPFGMVLIEGMAMGKPVVATKAGGPLDIVDDGCTGFLVEPGDEVAMAEAIIAILRDLSLAKKMGEKGRNRVVELFNNERYASQVEQLYRQLFLGV